MIHSHFVNNCENKIKKEKLLDKIAEGKGAFCGILGRVRKMFCRTFVKKEKHQSKTDAFSCTFRGSNPGHPD